MSKIRCVSVDDDRLILSIIEGMVSEFPELDLVGEFYNSVDATTGITKHKPDLVFLDIMMPGLNGLEVLDVLDIAPYVIVISGKSEIRDEVLAHPMVIDFLDKPIQLDDFAAAVKKAENIMNS